jgi:hypothetical protein
VGLSVMFAIVVSVETVGRVAVQKQTEDVVDVSVGISKVGGIWSNWLQPARLYPSHSRLAGFDTGQHSHFIAKLRHSGEMVLPLQNVHIIR